MEVLEAQRITDKMDAKKPTPRYIVMKMPKIKEKGRILKVARGKQRVSTKELLYDCQLVSQKKLCRLEGAGK